MKTLLGLKRPGVLAGHAVTGIPGTTTTLLTIMLLPTLATADTVTGKVDSIDINNADALTIKVKEFTPAGGCSTIDFAYTNLDLVHREGIISVVAAAMMSVQAAVLEKASSSNMWRKKV